MGQLVCDELTLGTHGTDPVGGGNIVVFIISRERCFRAMIVADEVMIIIDGP